MAIADGDIEGFFEASDGIARQMKENKWREAALNPALGAAVVAGGLGGLHALPRNPFRTFDDGLIGISKTQEPNEAYTDKFDGTDKSYWTFEQRELARVHINPDGLLVHANGTPISGSEHYKQTYVVIQNDMYVTPLSDDGLKIVHSAVAAGQPILTGGEIVIVDGRIVHIDNFTGHYKTSEQRFEQFLKRLEMHGVQTPQKIVRFDPEVLWPDFRKRR
ncbi:MAG TPA: hypothetical protein VIT22_03140 [Pseudoxanthomonas sp.]